MTDTHGVTWTYFFVAAAVAWGLPVACLVYVAIDRWTTRRRNRRIEASVEATLTDRHGLPSNVRRMTPRTLEGRRG